MMGETEMPFAIFQHLCPNCGERISADRLEAGLACSKCLPVEAVGKEAHYQQPPFVRTAPREGKFAKLPGGFATSTITKRRLKSSSAGISVLTFGRSNGFGRAG